MEKYFNVIRESVCSICADSNEDGECELTNKETCAIKIYLPQIIDVVHKVDSEYFDDYYKKLKNTVCKECNGKDEKGNCSLRDDANCSLDRYFNIIVESVKKVDSAS